MLDHAPGIDVRQGFERHPMALFLPVTQAASACSIAQPLECPARAAAASTFSASESGTRPVRTFVSVAMRINSHRRD